MVKQEIITKIGDLTDDDIPPVMIKGHLLQLGWSQQDINDSYEAAHPGAINKIRFTKVAGALKIIIALIVLAAAAYFVFYKGPASTTACTAEAKLCPDGSSVGRSGPACDFAQCPTVSTPAATTTQMANPASLNCTKVGGTLAMQKNPSGGEYGLCYFEDNRACEEWALMRGDCPLGGVKTTGYDTEDQKYCAWTGGQTFAVANSVCTFKDGSKCPTLDFYNGTCAPKGK
ncbi:MAG: DUF333 domain-containing protein [Candidatus Falkowbacteria bacterium]